MWLFFLSLAAAEPQTAEPVVHYAERTVVEFAEGIRVEGELVKPAVSEITARRRAAFASFIQLRTDFDEEIRRSCKEIQ